MSQQVAAQIANMREYKSDKDTDVCVFKDPDLVAESLFETKDNVDSAFLAECTKDEEDSTDLLRSVFVVPKS